MQNKKVVAIKAGEVKPFWSAPPYHRELKVLLSPKIHNTSDGLGMGLVTIPQGESGNMHTHGIVQETWFIISGSGKLIVGSDTISLEPNMMVVAPSGVPHQILNDGIDELKALFMFSPAGPEEEFIVE